MNPDPNSLRVVDTDDGPVTLAALDQLEKIDVLDQERSRQLSTQISQLQDHVSDVQARAGSILTARQAEWSSDVRRPNIEAARGLQELVATLENQIAELSARPHSGIGGLIRGVTDRHQEGALESQLQSAKTELTVRFRAVADRLVEPTGIAEADELLNQLRTAQEQVLILTAQQAELTKEIGRVSDEVKRRREAISALGFDALEVEADLMANGIRPIATGLVLKRGEVAVAAVPATLCRYRTRTQFVGGSQGLSIPLGHGFRYRVSSFRGRPIQSEALTQVDQGTLVVSSQRLVFLGAKRDVAVPIAKLLQIEAFSNAVGIGREGKETRDVYLVAQPAYVALFVHWVMSHQGT